MLSYSGASRRQQIIPNSAETLARGLRLAASPDLCRYGRVPDALHSVLVPHRGSLGCAMTLFATPPKTHRFFCQFLRQPLHFDKMARMRTYRASSQFSRCLSSIVPWRFPYRFSVTLQALYRTYKCTNLFPHDSRGRFFAISPIF
jgi:hypothetical protein